MIAEKGKEKEKKREGRDRERERERGGEGSRGLFETNYGYFVRGCKGDRRRRRGGVY